MATQSAEQGPVVAIAIGLAAAALAGLVNGVGVGVFKVHPLIMTLGMGLVLLGLTSVYQLAMVQNPADVPDFIEWLGVRKRPSRSSRTTCWCSSRWPR